MGIVVCLLMGVALLLIEPLSLLRFNGLPNKPLLAKIFTSLILLVGCWNALWYGVKAIESFWGIAAIGSGVLMIIAAVSIFMRKPTVEGVNGYVKRGGSSIFQWLLSAGLVSFFFLYLITLVRLNLGLSILQ